MNAVIMAAWQMLSGHKFNTGAMITIVAFGIQQLGVVQGDAQTYAAQIIQGVGAVVMVVGYIHKLIKAKKAAK